MRRICPWYSSSHSSAAMSYFEICLMDSICARSNSAGNVLSTSAEGGRSSSPLSTSHSRNACRSGLYAVPWNHAGPGVGRFTVAHTSRQPTTGGHHKVCNGNSPDKVSASRSSNVSACVQYLKSSSTLFRRAARFPKWPVSSSVCSSDSIITPTRTGATVSNQLRNS